MIRFCLALVVLFLNENIFSQEGWTWQNPLPQGNDLNDVCALDANTAIAVGSAGIVIRTIDGGATWDVQYNAESSDASLKTVYFRDSSIGWIVGTGGTILKTVDSGVNWIPQNTRVACTLNSIHFIDGQTGWTVGANGSIGKTVDGGQTWNWQQLEELQDLASVYFTDTKTGWIVGLGGVILHTTDEGATWLPQVSNITDDLNAIFMWNTLDGWAVGGQPVWRGSGTGMILRTTDGGTTWIPQEQEIHLFSVCFISSNVGWAAGWKYGPIGLLLKTTDGGLTWTEQEVLTQEGTSRHFFALDFCNANSGWIVGRSGLLYHSMNGGANWVSHLMDKFQGLSLGPLIFLDSQRGWLVGNLGGKVFKTIDGGVVWEEKTSLHGTFNFIYDIQFINQDTGWVVGRENKIFKTTDGGDSWNACNSDWVSELDLGVIGTADVTGCCFVNSDTGWAVGRNRFIIHTHDGGNTWAVQDSGSGSDSDYYSSVHFVSPDTGWVVGHWREDVFPGKAHGIILKTTDGGENWQAQENPISDVEFNKVYFTNSYRGWIFGYDGVIFRTLNGGETWLQQTSGTSEDLVRCYFIDTETGWVVGAGGTILHTEDGGNHWFVQECGTDNGLVDIYFSDAKNGMAAGHGSTLLRTTTGGDTWVADRPAQDLIVPNHMVLFQNYPNPFNPLTRIEYVLPKSGFVRLVLYDLLGRKVKTLFEGVRQAGPHEMEWNARGLPSGEYIVRLEYNGMNESRKIILEK